MWYCKTLTRKAECSRAMPYNIPSGDIFGVRIIRSLDIRPSLSYEWAKKPNANPVTNI